MNKELIYLKKLRDVNYLQGNSLGQVLDILSSYIREKRTLEAVDLAETFCDTIRAAISYDGFKWIENY